MNILLTGANGYIGLRLLPQLLEAGHTVHAVVRDHRRLPVEDFHDYAGKLIVIEADLTRPPADFRFPDTIDIAYFLMHSMGSGGDFARREADVAHHFLHALHGTHCRQIIYLGGIIPPDAPRLSPHLASRHHVQEILASSPIPLTSLRASIILGSGSASFEIVRDLVEKLPILITPRWTRNLCQPIAIRNVIAYLTGVAGQDAALGRTFDIGGPEVLSYSDLLRRYAAARHLRRWIIPVPVLTLRLSSWWLYLMTNTSFPIGRALVDSMAHHSVARDDSIRALVPQELLSCNDAIDKAFSRIAQHRVPSSWFDSLASGSLPASRLRSIHVPAHGVMRDHREEPLQALRDDVIAAIWSLGGTAGWPSMNWAWHLRGILDRLVGGIGLRRGRRDPSSLRVGDAVDFWRVLMADRGQGRLILYAEMKLPGEAWLEFHATGGGKLLQTATFRPRGVFGRLYWIACLPFHQWIFPKMARSLAAARRSPLSTKLPPATLHTAPHL